MGRNGILPGKRSAACEILKKNNLGGHYYGIIQQTV